MTAAVESCRFMTSVDQLPGPEARDKYGRFYFGNEFCEFRLPTRDALARVFDAGHPVALVTPIATRFGIKRVAELADFVVGRGWTCEVVVNDFGVCEALRGESRLTLVAGRLIARNVFDVAESRLRVPALHGLTYLRENYGIERYEITNYRTKLLPPHSGIPAGLSLSLYTPYMYLTTTRDCIFRFRNTRPGTRVDHVGCDQICRQHRFRIRYPGCVAETLYLKGNTLFVVHDRLAFNRSELQALSVDRIVYFADLPV